MASVWPVMKLPASLASSSSAPSSSCSSPSLFVLARSGRPLAPAVASCGAGSSSGATHTKLSAMYCFPRGVSKKSAFISVAK